MENNINAQIEGCKKLINDQLGWETQEQWKQRDYELLSELLHEKQGIFQAGFFLCCPLRF
jgi:hypothetical protein